MYISQLTLRNYRNFKAQQFRFTPGVNTLIGENGSGKSNAFMALRLMLDNNLPSSAANLIETDFNRSLGNWKGHWITISLRFEDLDSSEAANMLAHKLEDLQGDGSSGSYHFFFRPKKRIRQALYELSQSPKKDESQLDDILDPLTIKDYETVFHFRGTADFSMDETYKELVGDFEAIEFPNPDEEKKTLLGTKNSQIFMIRSELACTHIKALRDVMSELRKTRQSPLLNLLRDSAKNIQVGDSEKIIKKVSQLNKAISELDEVSSLAGRVKQTIDSTIGHTYAPEISIQSELPEDINKLFQALTLWVGDGDSDHQGRLEDLSLGGANLIYITLKLLEYEFNQPQEEKAAHFLLIEEPEAHIHTHIQKTMFENYQFENTQVITTTHSTHISSANKIQSANILCKEPDETVVCHPSSGLKEEQCRKVERYLDATRSTLLFSKGVILVEGDAELILIPLLFKKVFGMSLDEIGVSLINMSSTVFTHIADLFNDERIRRKCAIITDHDQALVSFVGRDYKNLNKKEQNQFNSAKKGEERKKKLDDYCNGNPWVEVFYAKHTFEVDFALSDNDFEIVKTLKKVYTQPKKIAELTGLLNSEVDSQVGLTTLDIANKAGKGWFALILGDVINYKTYIPRYILEAIAFATSHIGLKHFEKIAKYRVEKKCKEEVYVDFCSKSTKLNSVESLIELVSEYLDEDDDFFLFVNCSKERSSC
ncbi:AAA family ATPase [Rossellomorea marisflavi]|uniref:AAA family ATPase n=1 Tax=Rossellomorea marisflavi TaxID=189381 RepID=UPI00345AACD2